jgi:hypothetical protein
MVWPPFLQLLYNLSVPFIVGWGRLLVWLDRAVHCFWCLRTETAFWSDHEETHGQDLFKVVFQYNLALSSLRETRAFTPPGNGPTSCGIPAGTVTVPLHVEYPPEHFLVLFLEGLAPTFSTHSENRTTLHLQDKIHPLVRLSPLPLEQDTFCTSCHISA